MKTLLLLFVIFFVIPRIIQALIARARRGGTISANNFGGSFGSVASILRNLFNQNSMSSPIRDAQISGNMRSFGKWAIIAVVVVVLLVKSVVVVPTGVTSVISLFGKVSDKEISSGIHLINPLAKTTKLSIRTEEYTMSVSRGEGQRQGSDAIAALTNEGLTVDLDITVMYNLMESEASEVYRTLGLNYQEKIIRPEIRSTIREVVAKYDAKAIYSDKRAEVQEKILEQLAKTLTKRGITVEKVLLRNVTLPKKLSDSIQEKLRSEQESQRYDFVLQKETKEAERKRIEAAGQRDAQKIVNESLTPRYLQYLYINELKDREGTIYVPTNSINGLPLFRGIQ